MINLISKLIKYKLGEKYNCGTCSFSYYNANDVSEAEKCSAIGRFDEIPVKYTSERTDQKI